MTKNNINYIAGFFDGEGSVITYISKNKWGKGYYFTLSTEIGNTNKIVLEWIQAELNLGKVWLHSKKGNRRVQYHWSTTNLQDTRKFFRLVFPYLKVKKETVKLALSYLNSRLKDLKPNRLRVDTRSHHYTKNEVEIIKRIRYLNAVGKDRKKYEIFCEKLENWTNFLN